MSVLAVEVDDVGGDLGERRNRGETPVDVGPRAPLRGDDTGQHPLGALRRDEPTVDSSFSCSVTDRRRVGPTADEQLDRVDQHRLAGTGLPRDGRETGTESQFDALDDAEVLDVEFGEHVGEPVDQRSARPNLALRIWW